jgi:hypothetical protein
VTAPLFNGKVDLLYSRLTSSSAQMKKDSLTLKGFEQQAELTYDIIRKRR